MANRLNWDKANTRDINRSPYQYQDRKRRMSQAQYYKLQSLCTKLNRPFPDGIYTSISASNWIKKLSKEI